MLALKQKYIECVVIRTDCLDHLHNKKVGLKMEVIHQMKHPYLELA